MAFIKDFECFACGSTLGKWNPGKEGQHGEARCFVCNACRGDITLLPEEIKGLDFYHLCKVIGVEYGTVGEILERIHTPGALLSGPGAATKANVYFKEGFSYVFNDFTEEALQKLRETYEEIKKEKGE